MLPESAPHSIPTTLRTAPFGVDVAHFAVSPPYAVYSESSLGAQCGLRILNCPVAEPENLTSLHCKPGPQCRSNPVSGGSFPKTGIFQISAGDYRLFRAGNGQIRSLETGCQLAKARHWRAFLRLLRVKSPGAGLVGWRRSADRACLHANSLLTGNFTGNFVISRLCSPVIE